MSKILRYPNYCRITDEDSEELLQALDRTLSFWIQGAEHSKAYKGYINDRGEEITWDGKRHLLRVPGLRFAAGLLPRVLRFYREHDKQIEIVDQRPVSLPSVPYNISGALKDLGKIPRPYQTEAANTAADNSHGVIRIATGGGKTIVAAMIVAKLGKPAVVYVIGKDLLYQIHKLFQSLFDQPIGMIGDGKCEIHEINVATIWSVGQALGLKKSKVTLDDEKQDEKKVDPAKYRAIKQMLLDSKVHVLDECHLAACDTVQTIAHHIKPEHVYGMSASPWRDDGADMLIEGFLGDRIVDISARQLIARGYLMPPSIRFLAPPPKSLSHKRYQTVYSSYVVENTDRNQMVLKAAEKTIEHGYDTLVLFHSLKHGKILHELISKRIPCELLSGKDSQKQREKAKNDLESGKIHCLVASKIFDIGIDLPTLSGLVVAGGGKSSVRALQRIGRVLRPCGDKRRAAVIEFADQAPFLRDHAKIRREIYEQEFDDVSWPKQKDEDEK